MTEQPIPAGPLGRTARKRRFSVMTTLEDITDIGGRSKSQGWTEMSAS